jgi:hypothetical protein
MNCTASVQAPGLREGLLQLRRGAGRLPVCGEFVSRARALEKLPAILPFLDGGVEIHHVEFERHALAGVDGAKRGDVGEFALGLRGENGRARRVFRGTIARQAFGPAAHPHRPVRRAMHAIDRVLEQAVAHVEFAPRHAVGVEDALGGGQPRAALRVARCVIDSEGLQARQSAGQGTNCFPSKRRAPCMVVASSEPSASVSNPRTAPNRPAGNPFASVNSSMSPCRLRGGRFVTPDGILLVFLRHKPHHAVAPRLREENLPDRLPESSGRPRTMARSRRPIQSSPVLERASAEAGPEPSS